MVRESSKDSHQGFKFSRVSKHTMVPPQGGGGGISFSNIAAKHANNQASRRPNIPSSRKNIYSSLESSNVGEVGQISIVANGSLPNEVKKSEAYHPQTKNPLFEIISNKIGEKIQYMKDHALICKKGHQLHNLQMPTDVQ